MGLNEIVIGSEGAETGGELLASELKVVLGNVLDELGWEKGREEEGGIGRACCLLVFSP